MTGILHRNFRILTQFSRRNDSDQLSISLKHPWKYKLSFFLRRFMRNRINLKIETIYLVLLKTFHKITLKLGYFLLFSLNSFKQNQKMSYPKPQISGSWLCFNSSVNFEPFLGIIIISTKCC